MRGAYSESAAEKAYPNCEAVPCEQFDTAFEVRFANFHSANSYFCTCAKKNTNSDFFKKYLFMYIDYGIPKEIEVTQYFVFLCHICDAKFAASND